MSKEINKHTKSGVEILSAVIGGTLGLVAGPVGAVLGGAAGIVINKTLNELLERFLSKNEKIRINLSAEYSINNIKKRTLNGDKIRSDSFFEKINEKSEAEEIFEGILIKSKNEYQEKKIKYISNIFSNSVFDEKIKPENINQILETTERLTYRKICILKFCNENIEKGISLIRNSDYRDNYEFGSDIELELLLQDMMDLYNIGIIGREDDTSLLDISDVHPKIMGLTNIGKVYFNILGAKEIPEKDYETIIKKLRIDKVT